MKKPFNLEAAKRGKKVVTRDGLEVEIAFFDMKEPYQLLGRIKTADGWICASWNTGGNFNQQAHASNYDLFMAPVKQKLWLSINVEDERRLRFGSIYESKERAKAARGYFTKQIIEVEVEL